MNIRPKELLLATLPVESPYWRSSFGEEYYYIMDAEYVVINQYLGTHRLRYVCKIIGEFKIYSRDFNDYLYRQVVRRGIADLFSES